MSILHKSYVPVIGLEVHAQLLTTAKVFAWERAIYGQTPNTETSPFTLGHPGTLPRINKKAIEQVITTGIAVHSQIARYSDFARKHYHFFDLAGYQTTQSTRPICTGGRVMILADGEEKAIPLKRIHLEEDTAKSIHDLENAQTLLDFNRGGWPLMEMVTCPVFRSAQEVGYFLTDLQRLLKYLAVCNAKMEDGSMRCDANVSVMLADAQVFGIRVEIKNMNSIANVQAAISYEINRQTQLLQQGQQVIAETRTYDPEKGITVRLRLKEDAQDYRYFTEPNLSPIDISEAWIQSLAQNLPVLPRAQYKIFLEKYKLSAYDAALLIEEQDIALFFEALCKQTPHYKPAANWIIGPIKAYLQTYQMHIQDLALPITSLAHLVNMVVENKLSFSTAAQVLLPALIQGQQKDPELLAQGLGLVQQTDTALVESWVQQVIDLYPAKVREYREGKKGLIGFFMGELMKKSKNTVDPKLALTLLERKLT